MKLNLGCGNNYREGYVNIDSSKDVKSDKVWNLERTPLPFKKDSINEILAYHVLEHINNFIPLIHDFWRIAKKGSLIKIKVPFYSSWGQFNDPTHVRFFSPFTFDYFRKSIYSHQVGAKEDMFFIEKIKLNFGIGKSSIMNKLINPLLNLNHRIYCRFFAWVFPCAEIKFELVVIK